ncbi:MAG TPA: hypothetical protein DCM86_08485 [Verrucomicrobiales bacterium]|nr:hypothetical protein [Verrucomicrobiales bacterium]
MIRPAQTIDKPRPGAGGWPLLLLVLCGAVGCFDAPPSAPPLPGTGLSAEWTKTLESARSAVLRAPKSAEAWGELGRQFQAADIPQSAVFCYGEAARLAPSDQRWWHLRGKLQLLPAPEAALEDLRRAVGAATNASAAEISRFTLARSLLEMGREDGATHELLSLLSLNTNHPAARVELARIEFAHSRWESAERLVVPCVTNPYTARPAVLLLSQIRQRQGRTEEAARFSREALRMSRSFDWPDPILLQVTRLKGRATGLEDQSNALLSQGRLAEAEKLISSLTTQFPDDPAGPLLLGRLRLQQRRCQEAEAAVREHLQRLPESLNGQMQLALALLCQERWNDAIPVLRQALVLKPDFAQAHHNLGVAAARSGDAETAVASFKEALRYTPGDPSACAFLGEQLLKLGRREEALQWANRALELNPQQPRALELRRTLGPR